jgi:hypothetical protein
MPGSGGPVEADMGSGPNVMALSKKEMVKLAHRLGKRLLVDESFLDDLADALDGADLSGELSVTDSDDESEDEGEATPTSADLREQVKKAAEKAAKVAKAMKAPEPEPIT